MISFQVFVGYVFVCSCFVTNVAAVDDEDVAADENNDVA